jgi:hypothetical protein
MLTEVEVNLRLQLGKVKVLRECFSKFKFEFNEKKKTLKSNILKKQLKHKKSKNSITERHSLRE